jgi:hypothetical protein
MLVWFQIIVAFGVVILHHFFLFITWGFINRKKIYENM